MQDKKIVWIFLAVCLLLLAAVIGVALTEDYKVQIQLPKDGVVYLEAGEEQPLPELKAYAVGGMFHPTVELETAWEGEIDFKKPGTYVVTYTAQYEDLQGSAKCTIILQDTTKPVITLVSDPDKTTLPGTPYEEEGFSAFDTVDGDLTHLVTAVTEAGKVIYSVTDEAGNTAQVERQVRYDDKQPPVLTLEGKRTVVLTAGQTYKEPGWTATDNGVYDLTDRVTVSGTENLSQVGVHTLTYTVTDDYGNKTEITRTVVVQQASGKGKVIYLTFDDGPSAYTPQLLDVLKKYNIKATFFVCNTSRLYLTKRIVAEGHSLGLHSNSHTYKKIYASEENFFADLEILREAVYEQVGFYPTLLRFPGGSSNRISKKICKGIMTRLAAEVQAQGYRYFDWNVNSGDAEGKSAEEILENTKNGVKNRKSSVVLMHDIVKKTVNIMEEFILWALDNGYTFLPITDTTPDCHHPIKN